MTTHPFTLRQLQIFHAVVQTGSLTRAAKLLDVTQPSISQQLSRMEHAVGGKLVRFVNAELRLTPAGRFLYDEACAILGAVDRTAARLAEFFEGTRGSLVVGALPSVVRNVLMPAYSVLKEMAPGYTLDVVEITPREAPEQLQGRSLDVAIVSSYGTLVRAGIRVTPLASDPQVLVVPTSMPDLTDVRDPARELAPDHLGVLRRTVRYAFGSEHTDQVNDWYARLIPDAEHTVRCRTYESALAFVESGFGVALVPEFALRQGDRQIYDVTLYATPFPPRPLVLLTLEQYASLPGVRALTDAAKSAAAGLSALPSRPVPAWAARHEAAAEPAGTVAEGLRG
jgi:DNA-binding transcriptional LysR family regulator